MREPVYSNFVFSDTSIPDGVVCGSIGKFILISLASDEFTVRWCAIDDPTSWPTPNTDAARAVQAGQETLNPAYGIVTGISGDDFFGYIFQQKAITKFTYVGGDIVFAIDTFEVSRGCFDYNRFHRVGDGVFYESEWARHFLIGGQIQDIGFEDVDASFPPQESKTHQAAVVSNIAIDTVFFQQGSGGSNVLAYNYKTDQWTQVAGYTVLLPMTLFTIDSSDGEVGRIVYDDLVFDVQTSTGGVQQSATIETADLQLNPGGLATVSGVRPLVYDDGAVLSVNVGSRYQIQDASVQATSSTANARSGMFDFRKDGRYHNVTMSFGLNDGFTLALGADIEFTPSGSV